jgi:hypothetical protein
MPPDTDLNESVMQREARDIFQRHPVFRLLVMLTTRVIYTTEGWYGTTSFFSNLFDRLLSLPCIHSHLVVQSHARH